MLQIFQYLFFVNVKIDCQYILLTNFVNFSAIYTSMLENVEDIK